MIITIVKMFYRQKSKNGRLRKGMYGVERKPNGQIVHTFHQDKAGMDDNVENGRGDGMDQDIIAPGNQKVQ